jgi:hypothetical protein
MGEIEVKIKGILPWEPTVRVAKQFQHGRIFLAGDSAHQMPPWGGQGATTGIADVHNLAWKIAAGMKGQATQSLLGTYDAERVPIGHQVSEESGGAADERGLFKWSTTAIVGLLLRMPRLGGYGFTYTSQAVNREDTTPLLWRIMRVAPTLSYILGTGGDAGNRAPHIWVEHEGRRVSTLELFGKGFVLIAGADGTRWLEATAKAASSLNVDITAFRAGPSCELVARKGEWESWTGISTTGAVLIRPDGFVTWRSWSAPSHVDEKLEVVLNGVLCGGRKICSVCRISDAMVVGFAVRHHTLGRRPGCRQCPTVV